MTKDGIEAPVAREPPGWRVVDFLGINDGSGPSSEVAVGGAATAWPSSSARTGGSFASGADGRDPRRRLRARLVVPRRGERAGVGRPRPDALSSAYRLRARPSWVGRRGARSALVRAWTARLPPAERIETEGVAPRPAVPPQGTQRLPNDEPPAGGAT